ncbi:MAG: DUF2059 domain-containing protein [bacterium]|nr:DUF2059 domain-containing protein [bacterium]
MFKRLPSTRSTLFGVLALVATLASLTLQAAAARAEDGAPFRAAISEYLAVQGSIERMGESIAYSAANEALMGIAQSGVEVTPPMQNIVLELALETYGKKFGTLEFLVDLWSPIYAEHFSEKEIRTLVEFYQSPVGKKSLELTEPIGEAGMLAVQRLAREIAPSFQAQMDAKFKAAGITLTPAP